MVIFFNKNLFILEKNMFFIHKIYSNLQPLK